MFLLWLLVSYFNMVVMICLNNEPKKQAVFSSFAVGVVCKNAYCRNIPFAELIRITNEAKGTQQLCPANALDFLN